MPAWLIRLTNWVAYHLGLGESQEEIERRFAETTGGVDFTRLAAAIDAAEQGIGVAEHMTGLTIDQPISDALDGGSPPAALVHVAATVELIDDRGNTSHRNISIDVPWDTKMGEVELLLDDAAYEVSGQYGTQLVGWTISGPVLFPY